jgi:hypothetical protein
MADNSSFSSNELRIMREAFDAIVQQGAARREHLARLIIRAAREHGADNSSRVIEQVQLMLNPAERREMR